MAKLKYTLGALASNGLVDVKHTRATKSAMWEELKNKLKTWVYSADEAVATGLSQISQLVVLLDIQSKKGVFHYSDIDSPYTYQTVREIFEKLIDLNLIKLDGRSNKYRLTLKGNKLLQNLV